MNWSQVSIVSAQQTSSCVIASRKMVSQSFERFMIIQSSVYLPFPRSLVYLTYRDKLVELVPFLPNVRQIKVESRRETYELIYLVTEWQGDGTISALARVILSQAILSWRNYETWNDTDFTTDWRIETHAFTEALYCAGRNCFLTVDGGTQIDYLCELVIDPSQAGVPPCLAGKVGQTVEDFLSKKIEPILLQVGEGVRHYLEWTQKYGRSLPRSDYF